MIYNNLGKSGLKVSRLSFGAWLNFGTQTDFNVGKELIKTAYEHGVNFFDNAEVYGHSMAEESMGRAFSELGYERDSFIVSSKVFGGRLEDAAPTQKGLSRKHVFEACHQALKRLRLDYLDLYFCHRPDPEVPMEEIVRTMTDLIHQGKILYWGTSEWSAQEIMEAHMIARQYNLIPPTMEQPQYNMFVRDRVEVEYKRIYDIGLGTTTWSPLYSGVLTGKYSDGKMPEDSRLSNMVNKSDKLNSSRLSTHYFNNVFLADPDYHNKLERVKLLSKVASNLSIKVSQLAICWCLANPNVSTVILGASKKEQLLENLDSLNHLSKLTPSILKEIDEILNWQK